MGRAARAAHATERRIKLTEVEFHKLVSKLRETEVLRLEAREKAAQIALQIVQKEIAGVEAAGKALFETLAKKYAFDPARRYRFEEATLELVALPDLTRS